MNFKESFFQKNRARCRMKKLQRASFPALKYKIAKNSTRNVENFCMSGILFLTPAICKVSILVYFQFFIFYAVFSTDKCVCIRPSSRFFQSFLRLKPIAKRKSSVRTFFFPLVRNLRKPKSFFRSPNAPSTCIDRQILR